MLIEFTVFYSTRNEVAKGNAVVFGLQKTGEARYKNVVKFANSCEAFSSAR